MVMYMNGEARAQPDGHVTLKHEKCLTEFNRTVASACFNLQSLRFRAFRYDPDEERGPVWKAWCPKFSTVQQLAGVWHINRHLRP